MTSESERGHKLTVLSPLIAKHEWNPLPKEYWVCVLPHYLINRVEHWVPKANHLGYATGSQETKHNVVQVVVKNGVLGVSLRILAMFCHNVFCYFFLAWWPIIALTSTTNKREVPILCKNSLQYH